MIAWWPLGALAFSFMGALIIGYNQWALLDGRKLLVLRALGVLPLACASMLLAPWPEYLRFYAVAALMGVLLSYGDVLLFNASAKHGGRLAALYVPLKMLMAFVLWAAVEPSSLLPLLLESWRIGLLMAGFGLCSGALLFLRRADASWRALLAVLPVAGLFALADVGSKWALNDAIGNDLLLVAVHACAFLAVSSTVGSLGGLLMGGAFVPSRRELLLGGGFGLVFLLGLALLLVTLAAAPNPGYVAAITMLSALWLALWGWFRRGEHNNWWAGVVLVLGALLVGISGS